MKDKKVIPFANGIKKLKEDFKLMIDEMPDEEFIGMVSFLMESGLNEDFDDEFDDEYSDYVHDIIMDYGVPEKYCPVCQRQKKMQEDEKYEQYKELFDHFGSIKPNGCI